MQMSHSGRALTEGFESCRLTAYPDGAGVPTVGFGHTSGAGAPKVILGMRISAARADEILATDLALFERVVTKVVKVPLQQHEFDALVDLAFNLGGPHFTSSLVVRRLNAGNRAGAAAAFLLYVRSAGVVVAGLVRRRRADAAMFTGDVHMAISLAAEHDGTPLPHAVEAVRFAA